MPEKPEQPPAGPEEGRSKAETRMDSGFFDMQSAKKIQEALLPKQPPEIPGYKMGYYYAPRKSVGGDYCDFINIDKKHLGIVVADVSGHGVSGALVAAQMRTFIRNELERRISPRDLMVKLNKMMHESTPPNVFATMIYMMLEIKKRRVTYVNAGHPPLALKRAKANTVELFEHQSVPVGVDKGDRFKAKLAEKRVSLGPGDLLVAYTDGITEATNAYGEEFAPNFYKLLLEHAPRQWQEMTWFIMGALHAYTKKEKHDDDITLVSVRVTP
jgi:serine phosphatase RsbU (regulator of sigma subunit)